MALVKNNSFCQLKSMFMQKIMKPIIFYIKKIVDGNILQSTVEHKSG